MPDGRKRRALGQHFLRDPGVARAIADLLAPTPADLVLEIGPGEGALTPALAARAGRFLGLELDAGLARRLADRFDVRHADARTWDYRQLSAPGGRVLVVGNLPYSMAKPILMRLCDAHLTIAEMALMLQREVAERVAAPPGSRTYGGLSVLVQLHWTVGRELRVPPGAFRPPPRVDGTSWRIAYVGHASLLIQAAGINILIVNYKTGANQLADLLSGQVQLTFATPSSATRSCAA